MPDPIPLCSQDQGTNNARTDGLTSQLHLQAALSTNCEAVIAHAQARKAYKGAVIVETVQGVDQQMGHEGQAPSSSQPDMSPLPRHFQATTAQAQSLHKKTSLPNTSKQRKRKSR